MCHTGLGPSEMTEHSKGGLGMHVMVQERKSPTGTKNQRENERTDVSRKNFLDIMYQGVPCNSLWCGAEMAISHNSLLQSRFSGPT